MAEQIYFKDEHHQKRLHDVLQRLRKFDGYKYDHAYASALYVLSGMHEDIAEDDEFVSSHGIDFDALLEKYGYSQSEDVLIRLAGNLFNGRLHVDPLELSILDENNFRVALDALRIMRYGLKVDFTLRNQHGV